MQVSGTIALIQPTPYELERQSRQRWKPYKENLPKAIFVAGSSLIGGCIGYCVKSKPVKWTVGIGAVVGALVAAVALVIIYVRARSCAVAKPEPQPVVVADLDYPTRIKMINLLTDCITQFNLRPQFGTKNGVFRVPAERDDKNRLKGLLSTERSVKGINREQFLKDYSIHCIADVYKEIFSSLQIFSDPNKKFELLDLSDALIPSTEEQFKTTNVSNVRSFLEKSIDKESLNYLASYVHLMTLVIKGSAEAKMNCDGCSSILAAGLIELSATVEAMQDLKRVQNFAKFLLENAEAIFSI